MKDSTTQSTPFKLHRSGCEGCIRHQPAFFSALNVVCLNCDDTENSSIWRSEGDFLKCATIPNAVDILDDLTPKPHTVRTGPDAPPASTKWLLWTRRHQHRAQRQHGTTVLANRIKRTVTECITPPRFKGEGWNTLSPTNIPRVR